MSVNTPAENRQVLDKAMNLFWINGVANTSYPDIVQTTGLSRKALYARWPDKTALVHDALTHYRETILGPILAQLQPASLVSVGKFWDFLEAGLTSGEYHGCFLFRSAGGDLAEDPEVTAALSDHLQRLSNGFQGCFKQAIQQGDLPSTFDIQTATWQVLAILTTISSFGGNPSLSGDIPALIQTGRKSCGLK